MHLLVLGAPAPPAGGAALGEVLLASLLGGGLGALLLGVVWAHRSGRSLLVRTSDAAARLMGSPPWVALPTLLTTASLLTALFGMYWDISLHIAQGRDEGPLANPAHYFILFGLFGIFAGGVLAMSLPVGLTPGPASVRITREWRAPVGGLLLAGAGLYALLGFPLDDLWHRLFGQDVTLWGPTHLMLIGGAGLSLVGLLVLEKEGGAGLEHAPGGAREFLRRIAAMGGLLIGLSVFQGEFDFGVPQFRLVLQPALIAAAAATALVAARLWCGRGGALASAVFFLVVHSTISALVGPILGEPTPRFPLYLGSALLIELLALRRWRSPLVFALMAGALVGTLGTLSEAAWSRVFMPLPWGSDIALEGALMGLAAGLAGGVLGVLLALGLTGDLPAPSRARGLSLAALVMLALVVANGLVATVPSDVRLVLVLEEAGSRDGVRYVQAELTVPEGLLDDPSWVQVTAWQGGALVISELERVSPLRYRTTEAFPVSGPDWKTLLRVHDGRVLAALPVWLPADAAIDAPEVPAESPLMRSLGPEIEILQRERDLDVPAWSFLAASLVVLVCSLILVGALAWGVSRVGRSAPQVLGLLSEPQGAQI